MTRQAALLLVEREHPVALPTLGVDPGLEGGAVLLDRSGRRALFAAHWWERESDRQSRRIAVRSIVLGSLTLQNDEVRSMHEVGMQLQGLARRWSGGGRWSLVAGRGAAVRRQARARPARAVRGVGCGTRAAAAGVGVAGAAALPGDVADGLPAGVRGQGAGLDRPVRLDRGPRAAGRGHARARSRWHGAVGVGRAAATRTGEAGMSSEVEQLLRKLVEVDRRAAVWCACQCARTVLCLGPEKEERPRRVAIETAEAWVRREATEEDCKKAANAADDEDDDYAAYAAYAADTVSDSAASAASSAEAAVRSCAGQAASHTTGDDWQVARSRHLTHLLSLVSAIRWPLIVPTASQLRTASGAVQVAWDALTTTSGEDHTIPELIEARARAQRLGLDWDDPVQRAIAERAADEERVRELLGREGGGG